jgi:signal transduction histidine kinase
VEDALADIAGETQRMSRLVTELLQLARADAGQAFEREPVQLDEILRSVHRQTQLHKPEVQLELALGTNARVLGSADALQELFLILVDNGLKYTPPGGLVSLSLERAGVGYAARVSDTGVGIEPDDLPHIFERFYRATKVRREDGTGLGLAIAKWIAERHGGHIAVASTPGQGSTFTVWLPAPEPSALSRQPSPDGEATAVGHPAGAREPSAAR